MDLFFLLRTLTATHTKEELVSNHNSISKTRKVFFLKKKSKMSCLRSHKDQCLSGTWSPKSPFPVFANPALPHAESDLSFSPYTPEGVFPLSALPPAMTQSLFSFEAETLAVVAAAIRPCCNILVSRGVS